MRSWVLCTSDLELISVIAWEGSATFVYIVVVCLSLLHRQGLALFA